MNEETYKKLQVEYIKNKRNCVFIGFENKKAKETQYLYFDDLERGKFIRSFLHNDNRSVKNIIFGMSLSFDVENRCVKDMFVARHLK